MSRVYGVVVPSLSVVVVPAGGSSAAPAPPSVAGGVSGVVVVAAAPSSPSVGVDGVVVVVSPSVVVVVVSVVPAVSLAVGGVVVSRGGSTLILTLAEATLPVESVTVNVTSKSPGCSNVWNTSWVVAFPPSPRSQLYVYGGVPLAPVTMLVSKHQLAGASVPSWTSLVISTLNAPVSLVGGGVTPFLIYNYLSWQTGWESGRGRR